MADDNTARLSEADARAKALTLWNWFEKAYIAGAKADGVELIAAELRIVFTDGALAQIDALRRK